MAVSNKARTRRQRVQSKFQADLAPSDAAALQRLKEELETRSNADFLAEAVTLFRWAVSERRRGCTILSESATGERRILVSPRLERVAPEPVLPQVEIKWTREQLASFGRLASGPPAPPTKALIDLMKKS